MDGLSLTGPGLAGALAALRQRVEGEAQPAHAVATAVTGLVTLEVLLRGATALQPVAGLPLPAVDLQAATSSVEAEPALPAKPAVPPEERAARASAAWTPERREAQRQRMARLIAEGHLGRLPSTVLTPEREALLTKEWPKGTSAESLIAPLNALPGDPVTRRSQVFDMAGRLRLRRRRPDHVPVPEPDGTIPTQRRGGKPGKWTPERRETLRTMWVAGDALAQIAAALDALPGEPIARNTIAAYALAALNLPKRRDAAATQDAPPAEDTQDAGPATPACMESPPNSADPQDAAPVAPAAAPPPPPARTRMTPEREAVLRRLWPDPEVPVEDILAALNALPGEPYSTFRGLTSIAGQLGLPVPRPQPEVPPAPPPRSPEEQAALADAATLARQAKAKAMLALRDPDPSRIASVTGLPLREVFRLQGELRRKAVAA